MGKCDRLEVQGLDKEIGNNYHHELHLNNCFSGKPAVEGYEYQIGLRTRLSYFEQVTVVITENSGVNASDESSTWHSQNVTFSIKGLRVITTSFKFLNKPLLPRALLEDGHIPVMLEHEVLCKIKSRNSSSSCTSSVSTPGMISAAFVNKNVRILGEKKPKPLTESKVQSKAIQIFTLFLIAGDFTSLEHN